MKEEKVKKKIFASAFFFVCIILIPIILFYPEAFKDDIFVLGAIILFYFIEKKYPIPVPALICGLIPMVLDPINVAFGLLEFYPFGIGSDKIIHFFFNFLGTIVVFYILKHITKEHVVATIIIAVLIVNGIGNLGKLLEFVGSRYMGIYGATVFSLGDGGIPPPNAIQELVLYDPWWDLLFGLFGTITAGGILLFTQQREIWGKFT
jgi:hypothetical protein